MRRVCEFMLAGDYISVVPELTPEALSQLMTLAAGITTSAQPNTYVISAEEVTGSDHRFQLRLQAPEAELRAWVTWREIENAWKIVALGVEA